MLAQAPSAQGALPPDVAEAVDRLNGVLYDVSRHMVGNEYMIRMTGICLVAAANVFYHGLPGIGKTMLPKMLARRLRGKFHRVLYGPYLEPGAVFGVEDFQELQQGHYVRVREGTILDANIHFADEFLEASDAMKKMMLGLFDERPTYDEMGKTEYLDDLLLVIAASNRLPGPDDQAIGDRLVVQLPIHKAKERESKREILDRHLQTRKGELSEEPQDYISVAQVKRLRQYAKVFVTVPEGIKEKLLSLDEELEARGIYVSPRTLNRCLDILQATALLDGRDSVSHKDMLVLQYVVAPIPQQDEVRDIIYNLVAPLEREAQEIFAAISEDIGNWRALAKNVDKRKRIMAKKSGGDKLNDVANYRDKLAALAAQAEQEGYDAEAITNMVGQVDQLSDQISKMIRGLYQELAGESDQ